MFPIRVFPISPLTCDIIFKLTEVEMSPSLYRTSVRPSRSESKVDMQKS